MTSSASDTPKAFRFDKTRYPFAPHWYTHRDVSLHYVDEGKGQPVVFLHGNPTWSFLYRNVIKDCSGVCRCIAPDLPGFGLSGMPSGFGYTPHEYSEAISAFLDHLGSQRVILVMHDWGGPIGLSYAVRKTEKIAGMVLCNTWCWPPRWDARVFSLVMGGAPGRWLIMRYNFFARVLLPGGISRKKTKTTAIIRSYASRFFDMRARRATWEFPRNIRKQSGWFENLFNRLHVCKDVPVEMVWGRKDPVLGKRAYIKKWRRVFPKARVDRVLTASHYVPEDTPARVSGAVTRLLDRIE